MEKETSFLTETLDKNIDSVFEDVLKPVDQGNEQQFMRGLREKKRRAALIIALADLAGWWDLEKVTYSLSVFAASALQQAVTYLLAKAVREEQIAPLEDENPASGLTVLALGKLGAYELNYSSDIDLMILFDPHRAYYRGSRSKQEFFNRLARDLVRILQERTEDGYVFRTDLRLRPDPSSTPLAISVNAAESYYESVGQNWERAAMIKARPIAGDMAVGEEFLQRLRPFIWRKHLDFAAVQDIHSIKRQIHAVKGHREINVAGHDIKLGRGGIREIEFFAQTQQLIWGGRIPDLRIKGTCTALDKLAQHKIISTDAANKLKIAYGHLRQVEHRLQMMEDRQTHKLPNHGADLEILARFCGYENSEKFSQSLIAQMGIVEDHYAELFEEAPALSKSGNLVFTGTDDDPETLATIQSLGFAEPKVIAATIRGWHAGRYRAMRSVRARELLTELIPALLTSLSKTNDPGFAFHRFDAFLAALPAAVQMLSLLRANAHLLDLFARCLGDVPLLAERLSNNPHLIEALLGLHRTASDPAMLAQDLFRQLEHASHWEEKLQLFKRWSQELQFQAAYRFFRQDISATDFGHELSYIADQILHFLTLNVEQEFRAQHGNIPGRGMAILALGRLGSREMTMTSDLDLIFLYDLSSAESMSDGPKPLSAPQYFGRLSQRVIGALSAAGLYQVDMRLRPSGNNGPIASALEPFIQYQKKEAWTWEHMALTRARCVYGQSHFLRDVEQALRSILTQERDKEKLRQDILDMRRRIASQFPPLKHWDIKHRYGGDMDLAFIAQHMQLAKADENPSILDMPYAILFQQEAPELANSYAFWVGLQQYLRLFCLRVEDLDRPPIQKLLSKSMGFENIDALKQAMEETARKTYTIFKQRIGTYGE